MKRLFSWSYTKSVVMVWLMLVSLFWFQYITMSTFWEALLFSICIFIPSILITNYLSNVLLPKVIATKQMKRFVIQFIICSLFMAFLHFCVFVIFYKLETEGILEPSDLNQRRYSLIMEFLTAIPAPVIINLGFCGLRFYYEHTKLQETHLKAQLQILQQQVNPHFMFNVLNHIYILMKKDVDLASSLLVNYSEVLRYQLYNGKKEFVTLAEEVQFLKEVIDVEKMRWGNELKVDCKWNLENGEMPMYPLILIAFVENAFKHVSRSISDTGYINVLFEQEGNNIYLEIENSKSKQPVKKNKSSGIGLKNIQERLSILYPDRHRLDIEENDQVYIIRLNITL